MNNIFLTGFMGTGKSAVGRILAKMSDCDFFDSDEEIEKKSGMTIKDIFSQQGESHFRGLEREIIEHLASLSNCVISTGGGVVLSPQNMEVLRSNGTIISLKAKPEVILERISKTNRRPLLDVDNPCSKIHEILKAREGLYNGDLLLDTSYMKPEEAAIRIKAFINSKKQSSRFTIDFANGASEIVSGSHLIDDLNKFIGDIYPKGKILIISSPTLHELWGSKLRKALNASYSLDWCLIPDGEEYKSIDSLSKIYDNAAEMKLDRESLIIGFGGGVIGDISGFAASTFMRGIPCIQIPTTLLSQVDSSIGGKTAINYKDGKNLIGSFYQPKMIIADTSLLVTLPPRELSNGLAEVIKYGIISNYEFFEYLENKIDKILKLDQEAMTYIIRKSCSIKASIVKQDEMDYGLRMLLNYGHTIGHAIEAATDYRCFRHGEAVSLGMEGAAYIATAMGIMNEDYRKRQSKLLASAGLPIRFSEMNIEKVFSMMKNDKKSQEGHLRFVLSDSPGSSAIFDNVTDDYIKNALEYLRNAYQKNNAT